MLGERPSVEEVEKDTLTVSAQESLGIYVGIKKPVFGSLQPLEDPRVLRRLFDLLSPIPSVMRTPRPVIGTSRFASLLSIVALCESRRVGLFLWNTPSVWTETEALLPGGRRHGVCGNPCSTFEGAGRCVRSA